MLQFLVLLLPTFVSVINADLPSWHMKPLGSHIEPESVVETFADNLISPEEFANKYVIPRKPIIFRNVVKTWPAYKLWTDEYLSEKYPDMEMRLEGKKEKGSRIPKGDVCLGRDRLKTFLQDYREGADKYIVSDLPTPMWDDVHVVPSMSCGDLFRSFVEIDIWINSDMGKRGQGGNSILHKDAFNTVNCVINGTKEWKLIDLQYNDYVYQSWEGPLDAGYGGFSLVNPEKVDASKYPDVGKIPRWQFTTVNAGDCIYLPSQMWHQVKSAGETNRAIAFLFSQFNGRTSLDMSECPKDIPTLPLSEVDVDLQYPGTGLMPMGNSEIKAIREDFEQLVNETVGYITKRSTFRVVYAGHANGAINRALIVSKSKELYKYLLELAGGEKEKMNYEFLESLTRTQIRPMYPWLFPIEPANGYNHEYAMLMPEELTELIETLQEKHNGVLKRDVFIEEYNRLGGTMAFANNFWKKLAADNDEIEDVSNTIGDALELYEYHRRDDPERSDDEDATITTPQGHTSQPKKMRGGYAANEKENNDEQSNREKTEL